MPLFPRDIIEKHYAAVDALSAMQEGQARLFKHWLALAAGREMPSRDDLQPVSIAWCIANVALVEVEQRPQRFRYVTLGSRLIELYGRDLRDRYVDEVYKAPIRRDAVRVYEELVESRRPSFATGAFHVGGTDYAYSRLMLPLSADGSRVDHVLVAIYPDDPRYVAAIDWQGDTLIFADELAPLS